MNRISDNVFFKLCAHCLLKKISKSFKESFRENRRSQQMTTKISDTFNTSFYNIDKSLNIEEKKNIMCGPSDEKYQVLGAVKKGTAVY